MHYSRKRSWMEDKNFEEKKAEIIAFNENLLSLLANLQETFAEEMIRRTEIQTEILDVKNEDNTASFQYNSGYLLGLKEGMKTCLEVIDEFNQAVLDKTIIEINNLYEEEDNEL